MRSDVLQFVFQFIPKVLDGVEDRALGGFSTPDCQNDFLVDVCLYEGVRMLKVKQKYTVYPFCCYIFYDFSFVTSSNTQKAIKK